MAPERPFSSPAFRSLAFSDRMTPVRQRRLAAISRSARFLASVGAMASAFAVLVALNVSNPDALVVRVNLARAESGAELDVPYLASLSADAAPALTSVLESDAVPGVLSEDDVCHLRGELERRWGDEEAPDWRSWSLGRARARRAVSLLGMAGGEASCG